MHGPPPPSQISYCFFFALFPSLGENPWKSRHHVRVVYTAAAAEILAKWFGQFGSILGQQLDVEVLAVDFDDLNFEVVGCVFKTIVLQ